jgi:hypothetical protein
MNDTKPNSNAVRRLFWYVLGTSFLVLWLYVFYHKLAKIRGDDQQYANQIDSLAVSLSTNYFSTIANEIDFKKNTNYEMILPQAQHSLRMDTSFFVPSFASALDYTNVESVNHKTNAQYRGYFYASIPMSCEGMASFEHKLKQDTLNPEGFYKSIKRLIFNPYSFDNPYTFEYEPENIATYSNGEITLKGQYSLLGQTFDLVPMRCKTSQQPSASLLKDYQANYQYYFRLNGKHFVALFFAGPSSNNNPAIAYQLHLFDITDHQPKRIAVHSTLTYTPIHCFGDFNQDGAVDYLVHPYGTDTLHCYTYTASNATTVRDSLHFLLAKTKSNDPKNPYSITIDSTKKYKWYW